MAERRIAVDHLKLSYSGLFDSKEFYEMIDRWFLEKGFDKREMVNQEHFNKDGTRYLEVEMQPWKKTTDYFRHVIKVKIRVLHMHDVQVEHDGKPIKLQQGQLNIAIDGYFESDYEDRWEAIPLFFLLRTLYDKLFYRDISNEQEEVLVHSITQLHSNMKRFLNLYQQEFGVMRRPNINTLM